MTFSTANLHEMEIHLLNAIIALSVGMKMTDIGTTPTKQ